MKSRRLEKKTLSVVVTMAGIKLWELWFCIAEAHDSE